MSIPSADQANLDSYYLAQTAALAAAPDRTDATPTQIAEMVVWLNKTIADCLAAYAALGETPP